MRPDAWVSRDCELPRATNPSLQKRDKSAQSPGSQPIS